MEAYLRYVFSDSASEQYSAFSAGFLKVCGGEILSLFQPCELMAMVVGNSNYNWEVMEKVRHARRLFNDVFFTTSLGASHFSLISNCQR